MEVKTEVSDRELLELAANATGHPWIWVKCPLYGDMEVPGMLLRDGVNEVDYHPAWNPLVDDGDALRLAVKMGLEVYHTINADEWTAFVGYPAGGRILFAYETYGADPCAATRRAIVRAAAELARKGAE